MSQSSLTTHVNLPQLCESILCFISDITIMWLYFMFYLWHHKTKLNETLAEHPYHLSDKLFKSLNITPSRGKVSLQLANSKYLRICDVFIR